MRSYGPLRSGPEVSKARKARQEQVSLVLGRATYKLIRSQRALVAARARLATSASMVKKIR